MVENVITDETNGHEILMNVEDSDYAERKRMKHQSMRHTILD